MTWFCIAASLVYLALTLSAIALERSQLDLGGRLMLSIVLAGWVAPSLATWIALEGLNLLSPRRVLDRKLAMFVRRIALGAVSGTLGCALGVVGMAALDRFPIPDAAITAAAAAIAALIVAVPTTRTRKGECVVCRYSLAGATPASKGVCAECGADVMAG